MKKTVNIGTYKYTFPKIKYKVFFYKKGKIILICLGISIFFWIFLKLDNIYSTNIKVPLNFTYSKQNIVILKPLPKFIEVNISGIGYELIKKYMDFNQKISIEIKEPLKKKFHLVNTLRPQLSDVFKKLNINYIFQDTIFFYFDTLISKQLYVSIDSSKIPLKSNYEITSNISIEPSIIEVFGPKSSIEKKGDTVYVDMDDLEMIEEDFTQEIAPAMDLGSFETLIPSKVQLNFNVNYFYYLSSFARINLVNFPKNKSFDILPENAKVEYSLRKENYEKLDSIDIYLDYHQYNPKDSTICASYSFNIKFEEIKSTPEYFKIIPKKNAKSRTNRRNRFR